VLDPAILRPGRIDRKIEVRRPNDVECRDILRIHLDKKPLSDSLDTIVDAVVKRVFSGRGADVISGAFLANVVQFATSFAINREISAGKKKTVDNVGISLKDMLSGFDRALEQDVRVLDARKDEETNPVTKLIAVIQGHEGLRPQSGGDEYWEKSN
jgi:ATP-dependent 26S proteasome regulatory subunit